ncbi:MAG TPA: protoporphyrinogen oxidase [Acidimicrobiales bacterium]|nr:protoporphyrinogen oxidase [Acidimicrobiales bacterium]
MNVDVAVVGGGIAGLAAAWEARRRGADVVVLEADGRVGGKLRTSPVAGVALDESADGFLARVPEAVELCRSVGLTDELVSPATGAAYLWSEGTLRRLPSEQLLGVPTDVDAVAATGILTAAGLARLREDLDRPDDRPPGDADEAIGALVRRRLGDEVLDKLIAPLVGGIWAADCDALSLQVATPQLAEARRRNASLVRGAAELRAAAPSSEAPVFLAPRGGMGQLVDALRERLGDAVRVATPVDALDRRDGRWHVAPAGISADAVVVATPAGMTAKLVGPHAPDAGARLADVGYSSVALLALAVRREDIERDLDGSGYLVPPSEGRLLTACSWTSAKWPHLARALDPELVLLRASAGRAGDERALGLDDDALVSALLADLGATMGLHGTPVDVRLTRWHDSFPQPRPGHADRVAAIRADLAAHAPGVAVAGSWVDGVGMPACIRSAQHAVASVLPR